MIYADYLSELLRGSEVEVTERSCQGVHDIANRCRLARISHIEHIVEGCLSRCRLISPSDVAVGAAIHRHFAVAFLRVEQLPEKEKASVNMCALLTGTTRRDLCIPVRPRAVHHAVMDVEGWVAGRGKEVRAGVATVACQNKSSDVGCGCAHPMV